MNDVFQIPHTFTIPKGYFRHFEFTAPDLWMRITACGKTNTMEFEQRGDNPLYSPTLDWIQGAIEQIRMECDKEYSSGIKRRKTK